MWKRYKQGFHTMPRHRAQAISRLGGRAATAAADQFALTYSKHIEAAVKEVGEGNKHLFMELPEEDLEALRDKLMPR